VFERLNTPQELFNYKLGSALSMEQTVLDMLEEKADEADDSELERLLRHHHEETRGHVTNVEQAFAACGWEPDESPCLPIHAIDKEGGLHARKAADDLGDVVITAGARETEHFEIAMYENLITQARALGFGEAVRLLEQNLEQERHTLEEVSTCGERIVAEHAHQPA
jgi:ferritin-like metal-binding protein YciE